ncbi:hypothetical protein SISNIDRAFT_509728, partial [Sistotremastrum niveocremeum HHB9708]
MDDSIVHARKAQQEIVKVSVNNEKEREVLRTNFHLPPAPPIFYGRDEIVQIVISQLVPSQDEKQAGHTAILGTGGIGKTSVALSVIHSPAIQAHFQEHRYFIACDSLMDPDGIITALATAFNISASGNLSSRQKSVLSQLGRYVGFVGRPILIFLDNFETPWEPPSTRGQVEEILSNLAGTPNVTILLTMRGAERPYGVPWSRPFLPPVSTLDNDSARKLFLMMSDVPEDDPTLFELLDALDNLPLALLKRWKMERTAMLNRGDENRLTNLDVSIQVSLSSERLQISPITLSLLQILSMLPDGAHTSELVAMSINHQDVPGAITILRQVALVQESGSTGRIRMLSPVREHLRSYYP